MTSVLIETERFTLPFLAVAKLSIQCSIISSSKDLGESNDSVPPGLAYQQGAEVCVCVCVGVGGC